MPKPLDVRPVRYTENLYAIAVCPGCGKEGWLDRDQYEGKVSIDCTHCTYHETHDLRDDEHDD